MLEPRIQVDVTPASIPRDYADEFLGAFPARPAAHLGPAVRAGISAAGDA